MLGTAELASTKPVAASDQMLAGYFDLSNVLGARLHGGGEKEKRDVPHVRRVDHRDAADRRRPADDDAAAPRPGPRASAQAGGSTRAWPTTSWRDDEIAGNLAAGEAMIYEEIGLALSRSSPLSRSGPSGHVRRRGG